ncbi:MAG: hypothetical protein ABJD07_12875 [Gemmatimonadaceae bacterium]
MTVRVATIFTAALLVSSTAAVAGAQTATRGPGTREHAAAHGAERRERLRERFEHGTPEQKSWLKAYATERRQLHADVKAGKIDRKTAAAQLKAWRTTNKPPKSGAE